VQPAGHAGATGEAGRRPAVQPARDAGATEEAGRRPAVSRLVGTRDAGATGEAGRRPAIQPARDAGVTKHAEAPFENPLDRPLLPAESDTKARALALAWLGDDKGHLLTRTAGAQSCSRMGVKEAAPKLRELAAAAAKPISLRVVCIAGQRCRTGG
jgi:hypothetical protein